MALLLVAALVIAIQHAHAEITVATDFEGASAKVLSIDQTKKNVRIMPAGDPKNGWPCWWYLRIDGLSVGDTLTLTLSPSNAKLLQEGPNQGKPLAGHWSIPLRATYSTDAKVWSHTEPGRLDGGQAIYTLKAKSERIWLAWGPPFTPRDSVALVEEIAGKAHTCEVFELTKSLGGRSCPALRLREGKRADEKRPVVWVQARQHAWEAGSSWVCAGLARWIASDDPRARSLRERNEIFVVPIMDVDNTATGNGGKQALPHSHNRDWTDEPHYTEVAAAQKRLKNFADAGRLALFVDLHNPGPFERQPYFFVCPDDDLKEIGRRNLDHFLTVCRTEMTGPLELAARPRVSGPAYDREWKRMSKNWVVAHAPPHTVSVTLETPWNTSHSTTEGYQSVGAKLGLAIERYLREDPRR